MFAVGVCGAPGSIKITTDNIYQMSAVITSSHTPQHLIGNNCAAFILLPKDVTWRAELLHSTNINKEKLRILGSTFESGAILRTLSPDAITLTYFNADETKCSFVVRLTGLF